MTDRNMYGCLPCPRCKSKYRVPYKSSPVAKLLGCPLIECDECGLAEGAVPSEDSYEWDADGYQWAGDCRKRFR